MVKIGEVEVPPWIKSLPLAPEYHPTEAEFADPMAFILKIEPEARKYGICKVVPPFPRAPKKAAIANLNRSLVTMASPTPHSDGQMPMGGENKEEKEEKEGIDDDSLIANFTTRRQQLGWSGRRASPAPKLVWQSGESYTLAQFEAKAKQFARSQLGPYKDHLAPAAIETLFWATSASKPINIEYGNDIPGSAFACPSNPPPYPLTKTTKKPQKDPYEVTTTTTEKEGTGGPGWKLANSAWNMRAIARANGSLLRYMPDEVPGVTSPMIYIGMLFSWFAWHVEDHELHSLHYLHTGAPKTWYAVPGDAAPALEEVVRVYGYGNHLNARAAFALLGEKTTVMSPEVLIAAGVPCCRLVQYAGEFVITFPRAYHLGFSHGFNCGEAANFATPGWLEVAKDAARRRAAMNYLPMLSHQQLLYLHALSFPSRIPMSLQSESRSSRLKDKKRSMGEDIVKAAFVNDAAQNNQLLGFLLDIGVSSYILLNDRIGSSLDESFDQCKALPEVLSRERQRSSGLGCLEIDHCSSNPASEDSDIQIDQALEISCVAKNLKYGYGYGDHILTDSWSTLPCASCGVLCFASMAVVQPAFAHSIATEQAYEQNISGLHKLSGDSYSKQENTGSKDMSHAGTAFHQSREKEFDLKRNIICNQACYIQQKPIESNNAPKLEDVIYPLKCTEDGLCSGLVNPPEEAIKKPNQSEVKLPILNGDCSLSALELLAAAYEDTSDEEELEVIRADVDDTHIKVSMSIETERSQIDCSVSMETNGICDGSSAEMKDNMKMEPLDSFTVSGAQKSLVACMHRGSNSITNDLRQSRRMIDKSKMHGGLEDVDILNQHADESGKSKADALVDRGCETDAKQEKPHPHRHLVASGSNKSILRPRLLCLEHALEAHHRLKPLGGCHIVVVCHAGLPSIEERAKCLAEELGIEHEWRNVPFGKANEEDESLVNSAVETEEDGDEGVKDWVVQIGMSIRHCSRGRDKRTSSTNTSSGSSFAMASLMDIFGHKHSLSKKVSKQKKLLVAGRWCGKVWMNNQVHPALGGCFNPHLSLKPVLHLFSSFPLLLPPIDSDDSKTRGRPRKPSHQKALQSAKSCAIQPHGNDIEMHRHCKKRSLYQASPLDAIEEQKPICSDDESDDFMLTKMPEKRRRGAEISVIKGAKKRFHYAKELQKSKSKFAEMASLSYNTEAKLSSELAMFDEKEADDEKEGCNVSLLFPRFSSSLLVAEDVEAWVNANGDFVRGNNPEQGLLSVVPSFDSQKDLKLVGPKVEECNQPLNGSSLRSVGRELYPNSATIDVSKTIPSEEALLASESLEEDASGSALRLEGKLMENNGRDFDSPCKSTNSYIQTPQEDPQSRSLIPQPLVDTVSNPSRGRGCIDNMGFGSLCISSHFRPLEGENDITETGFVRETTNKALFEGDRNGYPLAAQSDSSGASAQSRTAYNGEDQLHFSSLSGKLAGKRSLRRKDKSWKNSMKALPSSSIVVPGENCEEVESMDGAETATHLSSLDLKQTKIEPVEQHSYHTRMSVRDPTNKLSTWSKFKSKDENSGDDDDETDGETEQCTSAPRSQKKRKKAIDIINKDVQGGAFPCDLDGCIMSFASKQELGMHKRNTCTFPGCGKRFCSHKYLLQHRRVHIDDRPLKCLWKGCEMTFKWAWARTEHYRVHTGERPYKCPVCDQTFRFVSDYSRHKRNTGHAKK